MSRCDNNARHCSVISGSKQYVRNYRKLTTFMNDLFIEYVSFSFFLKSVYYFTEAPYQSAPFFVAFTPFYEQVPLKFDFLRFLFSMETRAHRIVGHDFVTSSTYHNTLHLRHYISDSPLNLHLITPIENFIAI